MPKKARRVALRSALSAKLAAGELVVIDAFDLDAPRTKDVVALLKALNVGRKAFLVTAEQNANVYKSARNIQGVNANAARNLNVYEVLNSGKLVLTRDAVAKVEEVLR
jgi:large subunit ribosomal protein L4